MVRLVLEVLAAQGAVERLEARPGEIIQIGRAMPLGSSGLRDPHMSLRHFAVACEDSQCRIRDLGSTNGTMVNGAKISEATLKDGDKIEAGQSIFLVRLR